MTKQVFVILAILSIFTHPAYAYREHKFSTHKINITEAVDNVVMQDINGDKLPDIVIQTNKKLNIFLQTKEHEFRQAPDQIIYLADTTFLWYIGKVADSDLPSIFTMTSNGISRYRQNVGSFVSEPDELIAAPNILQGITSQPPLFIDFIPDINRDGLNDAILFQKGKLLIFIQNKLGNFSLNQKLDIEMESSVDAISITKQETVSKISIPALSFGDLNGDDRIDITYFQFLPKGEKVRFFLQDSNGRFKQKENIAHELSPKEKHSKTFFDIEKAPIIQDINGDGVLDLVVTYLKKGRVLIYFLKGGRQNLATPDSIIETGGWVTVVWLNDFDGDGKQELILANIEKFGIVGGIEVFLSKKVNLQLIVYRLKSDGSGFENDPSQTLVFSVPFVVQLTRESGSWSLTFKPNFKGDFNGDGIKDLIVKSDDKVLDIYYGNKNTVLDSSPNAKININQPKGTSYTESYTSDLNGDGISDLILLHVNMDKDTNTIELLLSGK